MRLKNKYEIIETEIDERDNKFMYILYGKPSPRHIKSKIKLFFKKRKHYRDYFLPVYNSLLTESPDIDRLIEFADFIRL